MRIWRAFVAVSVLSATSVAAQSEDPKVEFNAILAEQWSQVGKPLVRGALEKALGESLGGQRSGSVGVEWARLERMDLNSPPCLEEIRDQELALRVPASSWTLGIKARVAYHYQKVIKKGKWLRWRISYTDRFNVSVAVEGLSIGLRIRFDTTDAGRPRVEDVRPDIRFRLRIDSSNLLVDALGSIVSGAVNAVVRSSVLKAVLQHVLSDKLRGLLGPVPGLEAPEVKVDGSVPLSKRACEMRDKVLAHLMPHDTVVEGRFDRATGKFVAFESPGDSSIYTGHWLAAQALSYGATRDPAAQAAARRALRGILRLLDVGSSADYYDGGASSKTGKKLPANRSGRLVRYAVPVGDPYSLSSGDTFGARFKGMASPQNPASTLQIANVEWIGYPAKISRDQYAGVFQGLTWSLELLKDAEARSLATNAALRIATYLLNNGWMADSPAGGTTVSFLSTPPHMLALLLMATKADPQQFRPILEKYGALSELVWFNAWVNTLDPHGKYYKFDLIHTSLSTLLHLDKNAKRIAKYRYAEKILWRALRHHKNPYFATVAAMAMPEVKSIASADVDGSLRQWLDRPRSDGLPTSEVSLPIWTYVTLQKIVPYKPLAGGVSVKMGGEVDRDTGFHPWIAERVIPMKYRLPRAYLWGRSPFDVQIRTPSKADTVTRFPASDYQIAYWLARYVGILE